MELVCRGISKTFNSRSSPVAALQGVSFSVGEEEFVCIVGPSGCGKSTLLRVVAGLTPPSSGSVQFTGHTSSGRPPRNAMVFQEHGLFPWLSVVDNVAFGLEMHGVPAGIRRATAAQFLDQFGLADFMERYPRELSVGMRQRVALARAFLVDPDILLMDEPLSALDAQTKLVLQDELLRIWKARPRMVVYVTHDIDEAVLLGDRVLVMSGRPGRIREDIQIPLGRPRDLRDRERQEGRAIAWHIWRAIEDEVRSNSRSVA